MYLKEYEGMDVSIIIVSYNTCSILEDCIASIYSHTRYVRFEIIVVDNASSDKTVEFLRTEYPGIKLISLKENIGFGKANNKGLAIAKGKNIFFLNPDTILLNDAVTILYTYLEQHPGVALCGGNLYTMDKQPNVSYIPFPTLGGEIKQLFMCGNISVDMRKHHNFGQAKRVDAFISGADIMIRKQILTDFGSFDPDFFMYYEDTELSYRLIKKGWELHSVSGAKIIHRQGMSSQSLDKIAQSQTGYILIESRFIYFRKIYGKRLAGLLIFLYHLKCFVASSLYKLFKNNQKVAYWQGVNNMINLYKKKK